MSASLGPDGVITTVGSLIVGLAIMAVVLGATVGTISAAMGVGTITDDVRLGSDDSGTIQTPGGLTTTSLTNVQQSLGTGVNLSGDQYTARGLAPLEPPYTVTILVESATNASDQAVYTINSDNQLALSYNDSRDEFRAFWYNDSSRESAVATVAAGDVTTPTLVAVTHNGSHLQVSANATTGTGVIPTTGGGSPVEVPTWRGTQDELRVFNATLSSTQLATLRSTPTTPLPAVDTTSRVMFDVRDGATSRPVFFSGGSVDLRGIEIVKTVPGQPVDGDDYRRSGNTLTATDSGVLHGAPVAFITGEASSSLLTTLVNVGGSALGLLVIATLLLAAQRLTSFFDSGF